MTFGTTKFSPQDWKSGDKSRVVEVIAPFGGPEQIVRYFKTKDVSRIGEIRFVTTTKEERTMYFLRSNSCGSLTRGTSRSPPKVTSRPTKSRSFANEALNWLCSRLMLLTHQ